MLRAGERFRYVFGRFVPAVCVLGAACGAVLMFSVYRSYFRYEIGVADALIGFLVTYNMVWAMLLGFVQMQAVGEDALFPPLPDRYLASPVLAAYGLSGLVCVPATGLGWLLA